MRYEISAAIFYGLEIHNIDTVYLDFLLKSVQDIGYCGAGYVDEKQLYLCQYYQDTDLRGTSAKIDIDEIKNVNPEPHTLINFCVQHNIQYSGYPSWFLTASYD